ncbi:LysR family transcriptional regulator [Paenibacillus agilis]|uniref:LysR family transcriptional regulator n=1 Tax=Paenibacillus agilis TaxID=3020863 RepID=A0A559IPT3_9BACL|nr:LysR family transcriptional regulator [Paenibacillus agilis]TVX89553.1 LysR family transcriptional regulator [Paenibacillus agilis]
MNLEQLHHIVETAKLKSLSKASSHLHITQSGLSQSITALEKELGVSLFQRGRHGTQPTAAGVVIIKKAVQILDLIDEIYGEAQEQTEAISNQLSVAGIPGVMGSFVKVVAMLKKKYPHITVSLSEQGTFDMIRNLEEGIVDAAFVAMTEEMLRQNATLHFEPVLTGEMVVCMNRHSMLASHSKITVEQLKTQKFVLYDDDYVHWFMGEFQQQAGKVEVLFTTKNVDAITYALAEGLAVTVGHDYSFYMHPLLQQGEVVALDLDHGWQAPVEFGWLMRSKRMSMLLKEFMHLFKDEQYYPN